MATLIAIVITTSDLKGSITIKVATERIKLYDQNIIKYYFKYNSEIKHCENVNVQKHTVPLQVSNCCCYISLYDPDFTTNLPQLEYRRIWQAVVERGI